MNIHIDNEQIDHFNTYTIATSVTSIADHVTFTTSLLEPLKANAAIEVYLVGDNKILTAKIDKVSPMHNLGKWQARSTTSLLVDSCPITSTGEFRSRTVKEIIQAIATPFGIEVIGEDGVSIDKYNIEQDTPCAYSIGELCAFSGLLAHGNAEGQLVLYKLEETTQDTVFSLVEGSNCNMQLLVDTTRQASYYETLGQSSFLTASTPSHSNIVAGTHPYPKRACAISDASTNTTLVKQQTEWMAKAYEAGVEALRVDLQGLRSIYKGQYVHVASDTCRIYGTRFVESARYMLEETAEGPYIHTELVLVPPAKYGGEEVVLSGWLL